MGELMYKFTIQGNQDNPLGNPLGYHRATQGSKWNDKYKRYQAWKDHVCDAMRDAGHLPYTIRKPLTTDKAVWTRMDIKIYFANDARSDPDNVWKGIADALFDNDKYLSGSFDFDYDKQNPRVEVEIS